MPAPRPPMLLTAASYYGTLAAARCLGRRGIAVTMAERHLLAPARWSRFVTRREACPDIAEAERFLAWAERFGESNPGHVLYPTTDDHAWLFALHRERLARSFRLYSPPVDAVYTLLNKKRLHHAAHAAGLDTPRTWFPETERDLGALSDARFPVLIKPQTQVLFPSRSKGSRAEERSQLEERFREFRAWQHHGLALVERDPGVESPIVQELHPQAAQGIYSLAGFVDESGELFVVRASTKVLQRPRKLGIGLCFEEAPVEPDVAEGVRRLCRQIGYFGVFEVEFIVAGGRFLLIDFNPRLYSQLAFDVDRGMPLPLLVYLGAVGDRAALEAEVRRASAVGLSGDRVYCHRFVLEVLLRGQTLSGRMPPQAARSWRRWLVEHRERATDAVAAEDDRLPTLVDLALHLYGYARHPRAFWRSMILDV
ncbi:MAG: carbamoyl-phosphate synthase [Deltaproteobacteria bacterium]|nr:carbamoyl-phosphate synthase [Deltaproteobacteria bacterium]